MLDKRGRRIGYNWWRDLIVSSWLYADIAWQQKAESEGKGYEEETRDFAEEHPRPTLKSFMIHLKNYNQGE